MFDRYNFLKVTSPLIAGAFNKSRPIEWRVILGICRSTFHCPIFLEITDFRKFVSAGTNRLGDTIQVSVCDVNFYQLEKSWKHG